MTLREITGKRISAFSRLHRPAENGGGNHREASKRMDAIDGDLDLVCNWSNCRATLAVIETTTRTDQHVTYRRTVAQRLGAPFFHIREIEQDDGSWRFQTMEPPSLALLTMDEWIAEYEEPLRYKHGCKPWETPRLPMVRRCATYNECDDNPEFHCRTCWCHLESVYARCSIHHGPAA